MPRFIWAISQRVRASLIWRCAGGLAGEKGRLNSGSWPGGPRSRSGSPRTSRPARRWSRLRCPPGSLRVPWHNAVAFISQRVRGRPRLAAPTDIQVRLWQHLSCRSWHASSFPPVWWEAMWPIQKLRVIRCSRTSRFGFGHSIGRALMMS